MFLRLAVFLALVTLLQIGERASATSCATKLTFTEFVAQVFGKPKMEEDVPLGLQQIANGTLDRRSLFLRWLAREDRLNRWKVFSPNAQEQDLGGARDFVIDFIATEIPDLEKLTNQDLRSIINFFVVSEFLSVPELEGVIQLMPGRFDWPALVAWNQRFPKRALYAHDNQLSNLRRSQNR